MRSRAEALACLSEVGREDAPILIIGGGINGIGLYRDLAKQGIPAVLVDKGDFASGTSSASSRLIHGGLRYLETGEFSLVRESVIERNALLRNAPHLVRPLPVHVPAYSIFGGLLSAGLRFFRLKKTPGAKGIAAVKLGLVFFDRFGRANGSMPNHRILGGREMRKRLPRLSPRVKAVAEYYDTRLVHPEWLALELVGDAEAECPDSVALNYIEVTSRSGGDIALTDKLDGRAYTLKPRFVVNCAGVWVDKVNAALGLQSGYMGGTQGSHLILDRPDIVAQLDGAMLYFETSDFRACLIYAIDQQHILMGTTDIRAGEPDSAVCSQDEIDYIFSVTEDLMPGANFRREDISYTYSGIRPLPASNASATGSISRDHTFHHLPSDAERPFDMMVLVGGKWTTYRACAEQLADRIFPLIGATRRHSTLDAAIGGGQGMTGTHDGAQIAAALSDEGISSERAAHLAERYGTRAAEVAVEDREAPDRIGSTDYSTGEIRWLIRTGRVATLSDVIMRRTRLPFEGKINEGVLSRIATICAAELGWDEAHTAREIDAVRDELTKHHLTPVS